MMSSSQMKKAKNQTLSAEGQKQVDEEMKEFDHSDKALLLKLIEVYEQRLLDEENKEMGIVEDG